MEQGCLFVHNHFPVWDKYSFGCLYPGSRVSETITFGAAIQDSFSNNILSVQRLTADYTSAAPQRHVGDYVNFCRRYRWRRAFEVKSTPHGIWCLVSHRGLVEVNLLPDCQSIVLAALLISPFLPSLSMKANLIKINIFYSIQ